MSAAAAAKIYIVTGASRGLGLEFVKQISAKGDTVFACARNPTDSKGLSSLVDNKRVFGVTLDANNTESVKSAAKEIEEKAPEGIDVLVNNAGICGERGLDFENTPADEFVKVFQTNVIGVNEVTKSFVPLLRKRGQDKVKKILNMSTTLGSIEKTMDTTAGNTSPPYAVSKSGLNMLTKLTANKLIKDNILVYASCPGWVQTDMGGSQAPLTPERSVRAQLKVLDELTAENTGKFFNHRGRPVPW